jgi:antitoxin HicB
MFDYPAVVKAQAEGGFVVTFPDVPEAITQGEDREETLLYAVEALDAALSYYVEDRRPLLYCGKSSYCRAWKKPRGPATA